MGSALRLPIATRSTPTTRSAEARRHGCRIVATVPRDGRSLFDVDLTGPIAVLIGGEGPGLPPRARRRRRRARHDPDAGAGRIAERRGHGRADRVRGAQRQRTDALNWPSSNRATRTRTSDAHGFPVSRRRAPAAPAAPAPLAERMRPRTFDEFVGQEELLAPGQAAARGDRARPAAVDHPVGPARHRQDDARAHHRRHDQGAVRLVQRRARRASRKSAR